jgi:hypothetical protein
MVKFIALYEIIGGIIGFAIALVLGVMDIMKYSAYSAAQHFDQLFGALLFAFCIYTGFQLWKIRRRGFLFSMALQIFQSLSFSFGPISYSFIAGIALEYISSFGADGKYLYNVGPYVGVKWSLVSSGMAETPFFGINFVSIAFFIFLLWKFKRSTFNEN